MRRVVVLALLALALPIAAWGSSITLTNEFGSISIGAGGISCVAPHASQLESYDGIFATKGHNLGSVTFMTGILSSGTVAGGGTFSATGSSFDVTGVGKWTKTLPGAPTSPVALFSGHFVGPIIWTLTSPPGVKNLTYTLSGTITGTDYTGHTVTGTTTQNIFTVGAQLNKGIAHIRTGTTVFVPEPGTLGLLGTGLVGIAGMFRRKLIGA